MFCVYHWATCHGVYKNYTIVLEPKELNFYNSKKKRTYELLSLYSYVIEKSITKVIK